MKSEKNNHKKRIVKIGKTGSWNALHILQDSIQIALMMILMKINTLTLNVLSEVWHSISHISTVSIFLDLKMTAEYVKHESCRK